MVAFLQLSLAIGVTRRSHVALLLGSLLNSPPDVALLVNDSVWLFVTTEYNSLGHVIQLKAFSCSLVRRIASAMDFCHSNGILHLDLKPANILVSGDIIFALFAALLSLAFLFFGSG